MNVPVDRYAVVGNPIAHSRSPWIHAQFARQTGEALRYEARLVARDGFAEAVAAFAREGLRGFNVTVPFKEEAWALMNDRSERAERARAVNTVVLHADGSRYGDNTDGVGLVRDLCHNFGVTLTDRRVLVLGAGGAVRGVLAPLLAEAPAALVIANRTPDKAVALAAEMADLGPVTGGGFADVADHAFDVVIHGTPAGLTGALPPLPDGLLRTGGWAYDLVYGAQPTPFVRWAEAQGAARAVDGLGMLVEQAAESFYLWRGVRPETRPVIAALREGLAS